MASKRTALQLENEVDSGQPPTKSTKLVENDTASLNRDTRTQPDQGSDGGESQLLQIEEQVGDIFDAPENSVLIHACNCEGSWGAGIAAAFRKQYPKAFQKYKAHCKESSATQLRGTAYLIEPCEENDPPKHFIGCLFTSGGRGKTKDKPNAILERTAPAMRDLLRQIADVKGDRDVAEIRTCQINSGLFKVPWDKTKTALEEIRLESKGWPSTVIVYSRD
ncbi:hypothetical protein EV356DRAFT_509385 [Viridothelium virens]|uniref:ADP-ribose 1''-phosphate phosphatase n=1 Tax=Viridothelium virens TaxID=1048519 RepID=A0A6A6GXM2_VIRVR|nr:hypothetical protein EV356DRAFT_509385 [Viridothelium virens]